MSRNWTTLLLAEIVMLRPCFLNNSHIFFLKFSICLGVELLTPKPLNYRDAVLPLVEASADSNGGDDSFKDILANSSNLWLAGI